MVRPNFLPQLPRFVTLLLLVAMAPASASGGDLRTKSIRLVPEKAWQAQPGPIVVRGAAKDQDPKLAELMPLLDEWIRKAFTELGYSVEAKAPLTFDYTIEEFDYGQQWKRMVGGFWGAAYVRGTILVRRGNKEVGNYRFSTKPRGGVTAGSLNSMAKEIGPPLVLKLTKGESDTELHERKGE
jgi:hypothetical protein